MAIVPDKNTVNNGSEQQLKPSTSSHVIPQLWRKRLLFLTILSFFLLIISIISVSGKILSVSGNFLLIILTGLSIVALCSTFVYLYLHTRKNKASDNTYIESHITRLLHKLPLPAFLLTTEKAIISKVNEAALELFGYTQEELVGKSAFNFVIERENPYYKAAQERYLTEGVIFLPELNRVDKDGKNLVIDITSVLLSTTPEYYSMVILQDKTTSIEVQQELEEKYKIALQQVRELQTNLQNLTHKEERYHALFTQGMDAVLLIDARTHIIRDANPQADRLLGIRHANLVGKSVGSLPGGAKLMEILAQVSSSAGASPTEISLVRPDDSPIYLDVTSSPVKLSTDEMLMLDLRDATERHRLQQELKDKNTSLSKQSEELQKLNDQLQRTNVVKTQFLANMSHEIRTPLNAINGFAELLSDDSYGALTDEQKNFAERIIDAGQHLLQLINDVIDLAKVEAGKIELDNQPMRANHVVDQAVKIIRGMARDNQISIRVHADEDDPLVSADERRVKQVLFNLLSNAIRYSPEGTRVDVSVEGDGDWVTISVADHGLGIALEDQDRIFEEFVRVGDSARTTNGAGLGLPLSRHLIELHGGRLTVHSNPGEGSVFLFTLPVAQLPPLPDMTKNVTDSIARQYSGEIDK